MAAITAADFCHVVVDCATSCTSLLRAAQRWHESAVLAHALLCAAMRRDVRSIRGRDDPRVGGSALYDGMADILMARMAAAVWLLESRDAGGGAVAMPLRGGALDGLGERATGGALAAATPPIFAGLYPPRWLHGDGGRATTVQAATLCISWTNVIPMGCDDVGRPPLLRPFDAHEIWARFVSPWTAALAPRAHDILSINDSERHGAAVGVVAWFGDGIQRTDKRKLQSDASGGGGADAAVASDVSASCRTSDDCQQGRLDARLAVADAHGTFNGLEWRVARLHCLRSAERCPFAFDVERQVDAAGSDPQPANPRGEEALVRRAGARHVPPEWREWIAKTDSAVWQESIVMSLANVLNSIWMCCGRRNGVDEAAPDPLAECVTYVILPIPPPPAMRGADDGDPGQRRPHEPSAQPRLVGAALVERLPPSFRSLSDVRRELSIDAAGGSSNRRSVASSTKLDDATAAWINRQCASMPGFRSTLRRTFTGHAVLGYLLDVKDRHGDNLMLDAATGAWANVDFGFALGRRVGDVTSGMFALEESSPFRLPPYILSSILGGDKTSPEFKQFVASFVAAMEEVRAAWPVLEAWILAVPNCVWATCGAASLRSQMKESWRALNERRGAPTSVSPIESDSHLPPFDSARARMDRAWKLAKWEAIEDNAVRSWRRQLVSSIRAKLQLPCQPAGAAASSRLHAATTKSDDDEIKVVSIANAFSSAVAVLHDGYSGHRQQRSSNNCRDSGGGTEADEPSVRSAAPSSLPPGVPVDVVGTTVASGGRVGADGVRSAALSTVGTYDDLSREWMKDAFNSLLCIMQFSELRVEHSGRYDDDDCVRRDMNGGTFDRSALVRDAPTAKVRALQWAELARSAVGHRGAEAYDAYQRQHNGIV